MRRSGDALGARKLHGIESGGKHVFEKRFFVGGKFPEHVADHLAGFAAADAELEAREDVGAEVLEDGLDAVMAAGGAFFAETKGAEREGDVVVDHQDLLGCPFVEGEDLVDGTAAQVHERLGFEQNRAGVRKFCEVALPLGSGLKCDAGCCGEAIEHHESHVVAGFFILSPGIAEADDQVEGHGWE